MNWLERSVDLHAWEPIGSIVPSDFQVRFTDTNVFGASGFYRIRE
jgi:hypothetical protein